MPPVRKRGSTLESSSSTDLPGARIGRLGKPHGLDGHLGLYAEPEDVLQLEAGFAVYVGSQELIVREVRQGKKGPQVAFEGVEDREAAEVLRGCDISVRERRELSEGEYWPEHLVGLEVRPGGGQVVAISHGAAQDRLVVERDGSRFEVPFVAQLVPTVDLQAGFVEVVEIEGLTQRSD